MDCREDTNINNKYKDMIEVHAERMNNKFLSKLDDTKNAVVDCNKETQHIVKKEAMTSRNASEKQHQEQMAAIRGTEERVVSQLKDEFGNLVESAAKVVIDRLTTCPTPKKITFDDLGITSVPAEISLASSTKGSSSGVHSSYDRGGRSQRKKPCYKSKYEEASRELRMLKHEKEAKEARKKRKQTERFKIRSYDEV